MSSRTRNRDREGRRRRIPPSPPVRAGLRADRDARAQCQHDPGSAQAPRRAPPRGLPSTLARAALSGRSVILQGIGMRCTLVSRDGRIPDCTKDAVRISRGAPHDRPRHSGSRLARFNLRMKGDAAADGCVCSGPRFRRRTRRDYASTTPLPPRPPGLSIVCPRRGSGPPWPAPLHSISASTPATWTLVEGASRRRRLLRNCGSTAAGRA